MENLNDQIEIKDEDIQETDFTPEELEDDSIDWKVKAAELKGIAKRRATQLGKIKGKLTELETKVKELTPEPPKPQDKDKKSEELSYGQLAFLTSKGIEEDEDIDFVKRVADRSGDELKDVLKDEFVQDKLKKMKETRDAKNAVPEQGRRSAPSSRDSVEYWMQKGELPPDTYENTKLRQDIVNAKIERDKAKIR